MNMADLAKQRPLCWFYVTGHGLGHATRVIGTVEKLLAHFDVHIVSALQEFFETNINRSSSGAGSLTCSTRSLDTGAIQLDPLTVDARTTLEKYYMLHSRHSELVQGEVEFLRNAQPNVICVDATSIPLVAGKQCRIPTVIVSNFTWDYIYQEMLASLATVTGTSEDDQGRLNTMVAQCTADYNCANYYIQLPGSVVLPNGFKGTVIPGPLVCRGITDDARSIVRLRHGISPESKILVFGFGGHASSWALEDAALPPGWVCLVLAARVSTVMPSSRFYPVDYNAHIPDYIAAADAVLGKLGYGTVSECLMHGTPLVYVSRSSWPEEKPLETLMVDRYACVEMAKDEFAAGKWEISLCKALQLKERGWDVSDLRPSTAAQEIADIVLSVATSESDHPTQRP